MSHCTSAIVAAIIGYGAEAALGLEVNVDVKVPPEVSFVSVLNPESMMLLSGLLRTFLAPPLAEDEAAAPEEEVAPAEAFHDEAISSEETLSVLCTTLPLRFGVEVNLVAEEGGSAITSELSPLSVEVLDWELGVPE